MNLINFNLSVSTYLTHAFLLSKACFVSQLPNYRGEGYAV